MIDPCYACANKTERNSIASDVFQKCVKTTHTNPWKPPKHTNIIESTISKQSNIKNRQGRIFHSSIYNNCRDADVTSSYNYKHVDPVLKVYNNCPMMLNSNTNIEKNGGGKGTPVKFKRIVLKKNKTLNSKSWDSIPINSGSENKTEYMEVKHWEGSFDKNDNYISQISFRFYPKVTKVDINMKMHGLKKKCVFKNYYIRQYGALVNIATTRHKLQGMSKGNVISVNWLYGVKNWVYVVLSRVRTLSGLYFLKPLDPKKYHKQENKLTKHMNELASKEEKTLAYVKEIPKTSLVLENIHSITTIPNMDCKSLDSKRLRNNNRKMTTSLHLYMF